MAPNDAPAPDLERHVVTSSCGAYSREVRVLAGPRETPHRLCVVLDAELYLDRVEFVPVLRAAVQRRDVAPMTCVFVSHLDAGARHRDFLCSEPYTRFIAEEVVAWAQRRSGHVSSGDHLICGLSLSGLASAYAALRYPGVFGRALCQSGSFWWLVDHDVPLPRTNARFWLSVGDEETESGVSHPPTGLFQPVSQIAGVERTIAGLRAQGATVEHHVFSGGHDPSCWKEELARALRWLTGANPASDTDRSC